MALPRPLPLIIALVVLILVITEVRLPNGSLTSRDDGSLTPVIPATDPLIGQQFSFNSDTSSIQLGARALRVSIADTIAKRSQGLSGRDRLVQDEGMLFVFDEADTHAFWMKDMRFTIDIIWIGSDWKVVDVKRNADPASYPSLFTPKAPARYVLETLPNALP